MLRVIDRPFSPQELSIVRRAYARQMLARAGVQSNEALESAFATIERERFVGEGPWLTAHGPGYRALSSVDPVLLYQDILIALATERGVNNGSPSLHALWLDAAHVRPGERVAHLGAGTGYYSAILSMLAGTGGRIEAVEIDPALAVIATRELRNASNVSVRTSDAMTALKGVFDVIYVNFAVARPPECWIEALAVGGRLIFPLGVPEPTRGMRGVQHSSQGSGLLVERRSGGFSVRWLGHAFFVFAHGADVSEAERGALRASFQKGGIEFVRSLHRQRSGPPERYWYIGEDWSLSFDDVTG
jgi:protein-L-isoaspartate(D-aspartate) O-methyltransferase